MAVFAKGFIIDGVEFIPEGSKVKILRADGVVFDNVTLVSASKKALKFQIEDELDSRELEVGLVQSIEIVVGEEE